MKRPVGLIVGAVAGATLIAAVGASAHSGVLSGAKTSGTHQAQLGSEASGARIEPEPLQSPEPSSSPEPTQAPAPAATEPDEATETGEDQDTDPLRPARVSTMAAETARAAAEATTSPS